LKDKQDEYKQRKEKQEGNQQSQGDGQDSSKDSKGSDKKESKEGNQSDQKDNSGQGNPSDEQPNTDSNGEPKDSFGKPSYGKNGQNGVECQSLDSIFDSMEKGEQLTLDSHLDDDVPEGARKSIVNDFIQRLKNRGLMTSDIERMLEKLRKTKKDYLKEIKRTISHHIFGASKRKSITRPNRRGIEGIKGKKKYKNVINCILDTSGSMCGDFEKVLSFVFQNDIHINLIQIDTEVKMVENIKTKRDLQKVMIKGMGGTVLQPAIDFINNPKNKLHSYNNVILTDGYTDHLNFNDVHGKTLILTTSQPPKFNDPKGLVKCIMIDLEQSIRGR
jgi:predicted metal-dependent peptidase